MKTKVLLLLVALVFGFMPWLWGTSAIRSWMTDMYNQVFIKPQAVGSMIQFPLGSVTTEGLEISSDGFQNPKAADFAWLLVRNDSEFATKNPTPASTESLKNGEYLYATYCAACHGTDGENITNIGEMRGAVPLGSILGLDETITDGYLESKIRYGGLDIVSMPPFGYSTTEKERWDIVNYITEQWGYEAE